MRWCNIGEHGLYFGNYFFQVIVELLKSARRLFVHTLPELLGVQGMTHDISCYFYRLSGEVFLGVNHLEEPVNVFGILNPGILHSVQEVFEKLFSKGSIRKHGVGQLVPNNCHSRVIALYVYKNSTCIFIKYSARSAVILDKGIGLEKHYAMPESPLNRFLNHFLLSRGLSNNGMGSLKIMKLLLEPRTFGYKLINRAV